MMLSRSLLKYWKELDSIGLYVYVIMALITTEGVRQWNSMMPLTPLCTQKVFKTHCSLTLFLVSQPVKGTIDNCIHQETHE